MRYERGAYGNGWEDSLRDGNFCFLRCCFFFRFLLSFSPIVNPLSKEV